MFSQSHLVVIETASNQTWILTTKMQGVSTVNAQMAYDSDVAKNISAEYFQPVLFCHSQLPSTYTTNEITFVV